jgi:predicted transcriptional regulator
MKIEDLKLSIIEMILNTEDEQLLMEALQLLRSHRMGSAMSMVSEPSVKYGLESPPLADWQRESIERGLKDLEEGRFYTSEELEESLEEWLKD